MKRVAVIPARGGSKRLPRKNIRPFHGKPIIHYAIEAARASKLFDGIFVSTDDAEIATVAHLAGLQTVIKRPPELADDQATTLQAMEHAVRWVIEQYQGATPSLEHVCCIYPCTPFVTPMDLQNGFAALVESQANYAFPVVQYSHPVQRMLRRYGEGWVESVWPQFEPVRNQDLDERWHDAGQWYWGTAAAWLSHAPVHGGRKSIGIRKERLDAIDIDSYDDWVIAEAVYSMRKIQLPKEGAYA